jgi:hypothetical protein
MANASLSNQSMDTSSSGWVSFASYMLIVVAVFQMIAGFVAIFSSDLYIASANHLLVLDYTQWGWVHVLIGAVLLLSAASLMAGRTWGRIVAIIVATMSAIANFGFIWAYPLWSILMIVMDITIIYSIAMYGGRQPR